MQCSRPLHLAGPPNLNTRGPNPLQLRWRSEEHTSELQSQSNLVCRLLLEKKKRPSVPPSLLHPSSSHLNLSRYSLDLMKALTISAAGQSPLNELSVARRNLQHR